MAASYQSIQQWLEAQLGKFATAVKNWSNGKFYSKAEVDKAISDAKTAIVGENLKESLETLESIKTWKEQHGTEYTSLLETVESKANASDVYTKQQTDEKISEVVAGSVDLTPYLKIETYTADKATFETKENAAATYQPKGNYFKDEDLVDIDQETMTAMLSD